MRVVEVRFIKNAQCRQTGNEFYPSGTTAHFYADQAEWLVGKEWAVFSNPPPVAETSLPPTPNYADMTVKQLRIDAYANGIKAISGMRKADLIAALKG